GHDGTTVLVTAPLHVLDDAAGVSPAPALTHRAPPSPAPTQANAGVASWFRSSQAVSPPDDKAGSLLLGGCCQSRTVHAELAGARCTAGSRRHKPTSARCSLAFRWHRPACGKNYSVPTANPSTLCRQYTHVAQKR